MWHLCLVDDRSHVVAHKEQLCLTMVYDVVNLVCCELVQNGHSHSTVCQCCKESHSPAGTVSSAKCNLVAFLYAAAFEDDVKFLNLASHVVVLQCCTLKVGKCVLFPVGYDTFFYQFVITRYFHPLS